MGGCTSIRSQPANFAREPNPSSRLVKILLKDYIQYKRLYTKGKKEKNTHSSHTHSNLSQEKKPQCHQQRRPRGAARRGTRTLKQSRLRAQENPSTANEGDRGGAKRGKTHTQTKKEEKMEPRRPQYSQLRRPRETHSNRTKKDRNEKSHQRPDRYGHWLPTGVGKKRA